jgi:hypothetical protein
MRYKFGFAFYLIFFGLLSVQAKTNNLQKDTLVKKEPRIWVGLSFSPDYCNMISTPYSNYYYIQDKSNKTKPGYSCYFNLKCRISKNLSVKTGLSIHNMGYQTKKKDTLFFEPGFASLLPYPTYTKFPSYLLNAKAVFSYNFYSIPLALDYMFYTKNKRLIINVTCGAEINWLYNMQFKSVDKSGTVLYRYNYPVTYSIPLPGMSTTTPYSNNPYFSSVLNVGLNYKINNHLIFTVEPTFRFMFTSGETKGWGYSLYSIGINTGLSYTFL